MAQILHRIVNFDYKLHLSLAFMIRLIFIAYGIFHDTNSTVPYTDIDYKVFTDAARHVLDGNSPYDRHTYRYSPVLAILLTFNITLHHTFGKILFSCIDLLVGLLIRTIVWQGLKEYDKQAERHDKPINIIQKQKASRMRKKIKNHDNKHIKLSKKQSKTYVDIIADSSMLLWLYNPLSIAIATRGNCDSIAGFLVLGVLYCLQCQKWPFTAGILHGIAIHVRLYPVIYSLALFMYLSKFSFYESKSRKLRQLETTKQIKDLENKIVQSGDFDSCIALKDRLKKERKTIFKKKYLLYLIPNTDQMKLVSGCAISLTFLTSIFYHLYGYKFLYETYIYHFTRYDAKHNFSLYFYLQYLTAGIKNIGMWQKVLITLPKVVLLLVLSVRYGLNKYSLNFAILTLTIVMVIYNTVLTSQYFIWIICILPLCIWQIRMSAKKALVLLVIWFAAQIVWLLPAYFLEFQGQNTFLLIWIQSVSFFCANIAILGRLIKYFVAADYHVD